MKSKLTMLAIAAAALSSAIAGGVDPRFDGKWVGVERFDVSSAGTRDWAGATPESTTMIVIGRSGQLLGVLSGLGPGRYEVSPKSAGNTLMFDMPNHKAGENYIGRKDCTLTLSADGSTLKEEGYALVPIHPHADSNANHGIVRTAMLCQVTAVFKRVGR